MSTRAGIYTRLSLDRDGTKESPERQEAACRALCEARGFEVVEVYCDRDRSAFKAVERPEYERLMADVDAGHIDAIVVFKLDRLTRGGLTAIASVLARLQETGAKLTSVTEPVDTSTAMGEGMLGWLASQAKQESQNTSLRVRSAQADAAAKGRPHGGARCFGYQGTEIVPEEAAIIRECHGRIMAGESLRQIAFNLNARGVRTTQGKDWSSPTLRQMLKSPRLRGARIYNGQMYAGTWEPILTEQEHLALLEVLNDPRRLSKQRSVRRHLLTGTVVCGLCGGALKTMGLRLKNGKAFERYQCVAQPGQKNCGGTAVTKNGLDAHVTARLLAHIADGESTEPDTADDGEQERLQAFLAADQQAIQELAQARFVQRSIGDAEHAMARQALVERMAETEAALVALDQPPEAVDIPRRYDELVAWWETAEVPERRRVLALYVREVVILPARQRGGNRFQDERVEIAWR
ncbi:MAG TPA: recombinase family protein [Acidimicrobiales bacterium]|nr:recombinase family protein [Acidimicrobiales bacterium]